MSAFPIPWAAYGERNLSTIGSPQCGIVAENFQVFQVCNCDKGTVDDMERQILAVRRQSWRQSSNVSAIM